ncbi:hypothetical protein Zmor_009041 [Zophobas morio]|uniref:Uncharacterized protein n=1 Tax=Zophobas morio TaxID=2755281 RepID=A0AA38HHI4_9CUCU|nr:hypothetical protein Zmor_009041 [Zophobas morio]
MEFTLDYTGVGDSSSNAATQYKKVDDKLLENFNPYQTILENQSDNLADDVKSQLDNSRKSGTVLGKDLIGGTSEDLLAYDGTGMIENLKPVHHQYKVK